MEMTNNNVKATKEMDLSKYNLTSKLLTGLVFSRNSLPTLAEFGLKNVYLDDYGYKCKYENCLFFLFNITNKHYDIFENKIAQFESFYDWYDIDEYKRMLVYKIGDVYWDDLNKYRQSISTGFSADFIAAVTIKSAIMLDGLKLDYSKEIFRYEANLTEAK